jgi:2'-hydroxyisoflavone reductase
VSTVSVYADDATPGQHARTAPLHPPLAAGADETDQNNYSFNKVACEQAVAEAVGDRSLVVRAGLIVGPGDPSDRFTYWPARLARGGEVLAPGAADEPVQLIDVRDLAAWLVASTERRLTGILDGIGPAITRGQLLASAAEGVGTEPELIWVPQDFLTAHGVNPWSGPRSLPLWLPLPEYGGFMTRDVADAARAGLTMRSLAQTAADTFEWDRTRPGRQLRAGLAAAEETALIAAWHSS